MFIAHQQGRLEHLQSTAREKSPLFTTINTFKELMDYLNHAPEAQRTETLLADFSAKVGAFDGGSVCLGLVKEQYKMVEVTLLLRHYGITFRYHRRFDNELIVYAVSKDLKTYEEAENEFVFRRSRLKVRHTPALGVAA